MSFAEVKREVRKFTRLQRQELKGLLTILDKENDPKWLAEMDRRKGEMKVGKKISREEAMRLLGITEAEITSTKR